MLPDFAVNTKVKLVEQFLLFFPCVTDLTGSQFKYHYFVMQLACRIQATHRKIAGQAQLLAVDFKVNCRHIQRTVQIDLRVERTR